MHYYFCLQTLIKIIYQTKIFEYLAKLLQLEAKKHYFFNKSLKILNKISVSLYKLYKFACRIRNENESKYSTS